MNRVEELWREYWSIRSRGMPEEIQKQVLEIKRGFMAGMHTAFYQLIKDASKPDFQARRQLELYLADLEEFIRRES